MSDQEQFSHKDFEIIICRTQEELTGYIQPWDKLLKGCQQRSPMLSYAWVSSHLQHRLKSDESWYVLFAHLLYSMVCLRFDAIDAQFHECPRQNDIID